MLLDQHALLDDVCDRVVRHFQPLKLILFRLRARGDARPDSDLDLLVVFQDPVNKRRKAVEVRMLLRDLPVPKDIIVTTPEEIERRGDVIGSVLRPALREGRAIYERAYGCGAESLRGRSVHGRQAEA